MTPRFHSGVMLPVSLLALASTLACGGLGEGSPATVRDSAGVRIVEHMEGALERLPRWTLAAEPGVDIGVVDGPEEYQLYLVTGARVLRSGEIVVVNTGSHELRFYDSTGTFLRALGREGEGPGEFGAPWGMWELAGDTLAVWDFTLRRLSLFADGRFVKSSRLERDISGAAPLGVLADEQLLLWRLDARVPDVGFEMFDDVVFAFTLDGTFVDTLGRYPARLVGRYGETGFVGSPLFDAEAVPAAGDSAYWVGTGRSHELTRYDGTGAPRLVVRWAGEPPPVRPDVVERYKERELEGKTDENAMRRTRAMQEARPTAEYLPAYDSLVVDRNSALWMRQFGFPWTADAEWVVFGPDGIAVGRVTAPRGLQLSDIGDDDVLVVMKDELDVEHVRLYDLIKPEL